MAFTTVTVTCDYDLADGTDPAGTVSFTPTVPMINGTTVVAAKVTERLNVDGLLTIELAANTDPGTTPTGTAYLVEETIGGATREYYVTIPHDQGSLIALSSLASVGVAPAISFPGGGGPMFLANSGVPATPTGGGVLYVQSGALKYKGSSGTVTTLENMYVAVPAPTGTASVDTANIQDAIDGSAPGASVHLQAGTYIVNATIQLPSHISLSGTARYERVTYGSIIKQANGANLDAVIADSSWYTNSASVGDTKRIADLQVDGNAANQTSGSGIGIVGMSYRFVCEGVTVANTRGDGIRLTNQSRNGSSASGTGVENRITDCIIVDAGVAALSNNKDSIAIRDTGTNVTDGFITDCAIYAEATFTKGIGINMQQASGWLVQGNHLYGMGTHGMFIAGTAFTRIIGNYVEFFGNVTSSGNVYGIYAKDSGTAGTSIIGNNLNVAQGISGNTFYGLYLENLASSAAYFALGANTYYSSTTGSGTAIRAVNNGSNSNFKIAYSGQVINGFQTAVSIDGACDFGGDFGGYQNPAYAATYAPNPSRGSKIEITLTGNIGIDLPTTQPAGMRFTLMFTQDATGGRTVTFNNPNPAVGQYRTNWTPSTAANKTNLITFESDGYWLYQVATATGL